MTLAPAKMACVGRKRRPPKKNPRTMRQRFAARLHALADAHGQKSNRDIATDCGVTDMTVSRWFAGTDVPEMDTYPRLARSLGVTVPDLFS